MTKSCNPINKDKRDSKIFFEYTNTLLYCNSALNKNLLEKKSLDLIITSPPYNVGIEYSSNDDLNDYVAYLSQSLLCIMDFGIKYRKFDIQSRKLA